MDALVSYSDACTLPNLTPSCPYYVQTDDGPVCQEECRDLIAERGAAHRPVREVTIGGLVMRGRALPREVAAGISLFDAQQTYIEHRQLPPHKQSTSSLLLGLEATICSFPLGSGDRRVTKALGIWAELDERGVPVDRIAREAIFPQVADRIGAVAGTPAISALGMWPQDVSDDFVDRLENLAHQGWAEVLEAAIDAEAGPEAALRRASSVDIRRVETGRSRPDRSLASEYLKQSATLPDLLQDIRLPYSASAYFSGRVHEWLCRLAADDLKAVIEWRSPPPSLFSVLTQSRPGTDEVARWVWDRFTQTRLEDWTGKSLLHEWRSHREGPNDLPPRIWRERSTDVDRVATLALEKSTLHSSPNSPIRGLKHIDFVTSAVRELENGRVDRAANIFSGLAELRPTDGDVLNNLGFCLMPTDPNRALEVLQEASLYQRDQLMLSTANRVLALHLVGRNEDAVRLADEALTGTETSEGGCFVWDHDDASGELRLVASEDPKTYLTQLVAHVRALA